MLLASPAADVCAEDDTKSTALHRAAIRGKTEVGRCLILHGAKVDARDQDGYTALHKAAQWDSEDFVRMLVTEAGAAADVVSKMGESALDLARSDGVKEILQRPRQYRAPTLTAAHRTKPSDIASIPSSGVHTVPAAESNSKLEPHTVPVVEGQVGVEVAGASSSATKLDSNPVSVEPDENEMSSVSRDPPVETEAVTRDGFSAAPSVIVSEPKSETLRVTVSDDVRPSVRERERGTVCDSDIASETPDEQALWPGTTTPLETPQSRSGFPSASASSLGFQDSAVGNKIAPVFSPLSSPRPTRPAISAPPSSANANVSISAFAPTPVSRPQRREITKIDGEYFSDPEDEEDGQSHYAEE
eukprot:gene30534-39344_t